MLYFIKIKEGKYKARWKTQMMGYLEKSGTFVINPLIPMPNGPLQVILLRLIQIFPKNCTKKKGGKMKYSMEPKLRNSKSIDIQNYEINFIRVKKLIYTNQYDK